MTKRMLYIGTPKCASSSIKDLLYERYPETKTIMPSQWAPWRCTLEGEDHAIPGIPVNPDLPIELQPVILDFWNPPLWLSHVAEVENSCPEFTEFLRSDDYYRWTVVRNPWHRLASSYEYLNKKKFGCHGAELGMSFKEFAYRITQIPFSDLCQHESPERYIGEKNGYGLLKALSAISDFSQKTLDGKQERSITGVGCAWSIFSYRQCMKKCSRESSYHTQRWENSILFSGIVGVEHPRDEYVRQHIDLPEDGYSWNEDAVVRHKIMNLPNAAPAFAISELIGEPYPLDKVVRFENLQEGLDEVCEELQIERMNIPHINNMKMSGKERHYEEMYEDDDELIGRVGEWYKYEVTTFGYEFGR